MADDGSPHREQILLAMDNLNTHTFGSLDEAFEPGEVRRLGSKFEFHHTPKHDRWPIKA